MAARTATFATYGSDLIGGIDEASPEGDRFPVALLRGGDFFGFGLSAGVFALSAFNGPLSTGSNFGLRYAR